MANIRENKKNGRVVSYRFTACLERDHLGKQARKYTAWTPPEVPGDYVKKPMRACTGREICMEWLYHPGVPEDQIEELAEQSANTVPVMMPFSLPCPVRTNFCSCSECVMSLRNRSALMISLSQNCNVISSMI